MMNQSIVTVEEAYERELVFFDDPTLSYAHADPHADHAGLAVEIIPSTLPRHYLVFCAVCGRSSLLHAHDLLFVEHSEVDELEPSGD